MKKFLSLLIFFTVRFSVMAEPLMPQDISIIKKTYSDINIKCEFDSVVYDWKIIINGGSKKEQVLYWCKGSFLPVEELENKDNYWSIFYDYPKELADPSKMTEEQKNRLKEFTSAENRKNGAGTPMFIYDAIYDSYKRGELEKHIKRISFLGHKTNVHERIIEPLMKVEKNILEATKTDKEVNAFVNKIKSADAYYWREIEGTKRKSFHSLGIAMDIMPVRITGEIFWSWAKDKNPDGWMFTPLWYRWMPPEKVITIFEDEGFIWGGKWVIWDNMHFEYHPEILMKNRE